MNPTRALNLLLRDAVADVATALAATGPQAELAALGAASRLEHTFREAATIAVELDIDWTALKPELDAGVSARSTVAQKLVRPAHFEIVLAMHAAWKNFEEEIPQNEWKAQDKPAALGRATSLDNGEAIELAQQSVAAAISQADKFLAAPDKVKADAECDVIATHLERAEKTLSLSGNATKSQRFQFSAHVADLSDRLEKLNTYLAAAPKAEWDRSYAALFDTEFRLRKLVGFTTRPPRAYSGTLDPKAALALISALDEAKETKDPAKIKQAEDALNNAKANLVSTPDQAITSLTLAVSEAYDTKSRTMVDLGQNLDEVLPQEMSSWDHILMIAANMIISATSKVLGGVISSGFEGAVDRSAKSTFAASVRLDEERLGAKLSDSVRDSRVEALMKGSSLKRKLTSGIASDLTMKLLFEGKSLAGESEAGNKALTLKNRYIQTNIATIHASKYGVLNKINQLAVALEQLEIEDIVAVAKALRGGIKQVSDATYEAGLIQWQNTKARTASPPKTGGPHILTDVNLQGERKELTEATIPGVIEVGVYAGTDAKTPVVDYVVLRDGEDAAISFLRKLDRPLHALDMNRMFQLNFSQTPWARDSANEKVSRPGHGTFSTYVKFGIGRRGKVQDSSFDDKELDLMRMYAANLNPSDDVLNRMLARKYKQVSDADAIAAALELVRVASKLTTASIRKEK